MCHYSSQCYFFFSEFSVCRKVANFNLSEMPKKLVEINKWIMAKILLKTSNYFHVPAIAFLLVKHWNQTYNNTIMIFHFWFFEGDKQISPFYTLLWIKRRACFGANNRHDTLNPRIWSKLQQTLDEMLTYIILLLLNNSVIIIYFFC